MNGLGLYRRNINLLAVAFCAFSLRFLVDSDYLLANNPDEKIDQLSDASEKTDEKIKILVERIYELLEQNRSYGEIMEMLDDGEDGQYDIKKLVTRIHEFFDKQDSKENVIKIIVDNKNAEEYYAHKLFWARAKDYYFALKVIAAVILAASIGYLIIKWVKLPLHGSPSGIISGLPEPKLTDNPLEKEPPKIEIMQQQLPKNKVLQQVRIEQGLPQPNKEPVVQTQAETVQLCDMPTGNKSCLINHELYKSVMQQLEEAEKIGLHPIELPPPVGMEEQNSAGQETRTRDEVLQQQIEEARKLGIIPAE
jgi:hypothetical protein